MSNEELEELYSNNEDFKHYVDAFAVNRHKPVEECLYFAITKEVAKMYKEIENGKKDSELPRMVPEMQVCDKR